VTNNPRTETEAVDAKKVQAAIEHLRNGDVEGARCLLEEVIANAPDEYVYQYEEEGKLYIKFWDQSEFMHYVEWQSKQGKAERPVIWTESAYPHAYYLLGYINVDQKSYRRALELLEAGQRLEPGNPKFLIEKAVAYSALGEHEQALSLYTQIPDAGPRVTSAQKARALRGKGYELIELGQLDAAEEAFRESLKYEPDSKVALNELGFIAELRRRQWPRPGLKLVSDLLGSMRKK